jgi:hypothetical protein
MQLKVDTVTALFTRGQRNGVIEMTAAHKLSALQIETILDKVVPLIAAPADHGFFRGVIGLKLENCNSSAAAMFVRSLLEQAA